MREKPLEKVGADDINGLVSNNVLERRTLEYKVRLPDSSDGGKKEFLADVSSFANSVGGDLIFGIAEKDGVLSEAYGLDVSNVDTEISRLENLIRDGISPRVAVEIRGIPVPDGKVVFLLRVQASLESPHRVIFKSHDKFYARNSNGKYPMDVLELGAAFARTGSIAQRIRDFRIGRILELKSDSKIPDEQGFLVIHMVPLTAVTTSFKVGADELLRLNNGEINSFKPIYAGAWSHRINLDGVVAYTSAGQNKVVESYTQLYREGIIEAFDTNVFQWRDDKKILPMAAIETRVTDYIKNCLTFLWGFGFQPPIYAFLCPGNVRGYTVAIPEHHWTADSDVITARDLILPETIIDSVDENLEHKLRSTFDLIWNAAGLSRSLNFDENDNLIRNR